MAIADDIAAAIATDLAAADLSLDFTATRDIHPLTARIDIDGVMVTCTPVEERAVILDRARCEYSYDTMIAVRKRLSDTDAAAPDSALAPLRTLVDEIADRLRLGHVLDDYPTAIWQGHRRQMNDRHIEELSQFTELLTVTHRVFR